MSASKTGKKSKSLSPAEALILLRSAIGIVLEAGFRVGARNGDGGVLITIAGAAVTYRDGKADFVPQSEKSVARVDVPHSEPVPQLVDPSSMPRSEGETYRGSGDIQ